MKAKNQHLIVILADLLIMSMDMYKEAVSSQERFSARLSLIKVITLLRTVICGNSIEDE